MYPSAAQRQSYYADPVIRERLEDFLGGKPPGHASAVYFTPGTEWESCYRNPTSLREWPEWLARGAELNRSLWDKDSLLAHLDIEYVNFDFPARVYLEAPAVFACQQPVVEAVEAILAEAGLVPLHLLTGRGHHFVWRVSRRSQVFTRLRHLGRMADSLANLYGSYRGPEGQTVDQELGLAFAGLGLVMEYLADQVIARAAEACPLPVELAALEAGGLGHGREVVAVDITEYADPLCSRVIRVPFSVYLKPWQQHYLLGDDTAAGLAPIFLLPLDGLDIDEALILRREASAVREYAARACSAIPEVPAGLGTLLEKYQASALARFHDWYYGEEPEPAAAWPATYDRLNPEMLPPCVRHILSHPNDFLLRPGCVQRVVRVLLAMGWHPRHIAGLIRSRYERDYGWGDQWFGYDPATRADFYARVFTGQFVSGTDALVDFNCQSAREEGLCFVEPCGDNLLRFRNTLLKRKTYERLGSGPLHGLFLSKEHT